MRERERGFLKSNLSKNPMKTRERSLREFEREWVNESWVWELNTRFCRSPSPAVRGNAATASSPITGRRRPDSGHPCCSSHLVRTPMSSPHPPLPFPHPHLIPCTPERRLARARPTGGHGHDRFELLHLIHPMNTTCLCLGPNKFHHYIL